MTSLLKKPSLALLSLMVATSAYALKPQDKVLTGDFKIDPDHTRVEFTVGHFVVSEVQGRFNQVEGKMTLEKDLHKSSVEATIQTASVDTGVAKRDEDLRSPRFLDAVKYPTMTFKSTAFNGSAGNFQLVGDLTIKDVTKRVTFTGKYTGNVKDPWGNTRVALQAKTKISRKDFHIEYNDKVDIGDAVGDQVTINLIVEAVKQ
jgi:polyisoprenoid-binding protein YceI